MYGQHSKLVAHPGRRKDFVDILLRAAARVGDLDGCRVYLVHEDTADPDTIWVTEVWNSREHHQNSLQDPEVRSLIEAAMPLLSGAPAATELTPVGGHGLS
jgi:quinol monooxygenase YgiN